MELVTRIGKKGEIYTTRRIREVSGIKPKDAVRIRATKGTIIIEKLPSIEDMIADTPVEITFEEAEELSEEAQKRVEELGASKYAS